MNSFKSPRSFVYPFVVLVLVPNFAFSNLQAQPEEAEKKEEAAVEEQGKEEDKSGETAKPADESEKGKAEAGKGEKDDKETDAKTAEATEKDKDGKTGDAPEGMIDLGENPLSPEDMKKVMDWIAHRAASIKIPFCWRGSEGRGAGEPFACEEGTTRTGLLCYPGSKPLKMGTCAANQEVGGALCYPKCKEHFHGNGPVCWQTCPPDQPHDCGAACSKNAEECKNGVVNMVFGPLIAAATIVSAVVTFGGAAAASTVVKTAVKTAVKEGVKAGVKMALNEIVKAVADKLKGKVNVAEMSAAAAKAETGGKQLVPKTPLMEEIDQFSKQYADDFAGLTNAETEEAINSKFGTEAAYQIKRQYGIRHISMMLKAEGVEKAEQAISAVTAADPTGIGDAVNAFVKPICMVPVPFPEVTPLYTR